MEIVFALIAGAVALGVLGLGIYLIRTDRQKEIDTRLGRYTQDYKTLLADLEAAEQEEELDRNESGAITQALDRAIEDRQFAQKWREELARADLKMTPGEYAASHVFAIVGAAAVVFFILAPGNPIAAVVGGFIGFFIPRIYVGMRKGKRLRNFETQLADTISMWVNGLRAGYSVLQSMEAIAKEAPEPTNTEFRRVVQEIQLGLSREEAFDHMLSRVPSDDLDLIITAVNIQAEVGGNLAEILDVIGYTIRERIKLKGEIRVLTAQGRMTGYIIGGLPIALAILLYLISPTYMGRMFNDRLCGWPLLGCAAMLIGLGFAAIQKIVAIDI
jgi:tight adherence protein B